jgi:hypothetical protein
MLRHGPAQIDDAVGDDGAPGFAALVNKGQKLHENSRLKKEERRKR